MTGQLNEEASAKVTPLVTDIRRAQDLQACETAYQAVEQDNHAALRWFTVQILKFTGPWLHVVCLALIDKDKGGVLRWRTAQNPLALLRKIAWHGAATWAPHLRRLRPNRGHEDLITDAIGANGGNYSEALDRFVYQQVGNEEYDELRDLDKALVIDEIHLIPREDGRLFRIGWVYDWKEIGRRMDWDSDQTELMRARALGITRRDMPKHLGWTEARCEAVWRSISRRISHGGCPEKARATLLEH